METIGKNVSGKTDHKEKGSKLFVLFALLLGLAVGLAVGLILRRPLFGILGGIAGLIAGIFIFRPGKKADPGYIRVQGMSKEIFEQTLREGNEKLSTLRTLTIKVRDREIKRKANHICDLTKLILDDIEKDPDDLRPARSFLNYYLDAAVKILESYNDIVVNQISSKEVDEIPTKVDRNLGTLEEAFEKQLAKLMENDVMDLDTELTVLEKTLEMEGYGPKEKSDREPS
jgi:5-bromo-4-chloroindolyl phosphate hydrolysis protein